MPLKNGQMTAKERMIARAAAVTGENVSEVARRAGVTERNVYFALDRPAVRDMMRREQMAELEKAVTLAVETLVTVMSDKTCARGLQIRAAEVTLKYGLRPGDETADKDPSQLTGAELADLAQRLRRQLAGEVTDVDPEPGGVFE